MNSDNLFLDAQVTDSEKDVFGQVSDSIAQFNQLLTDLRDYQGAEAERRQVRYLLLVGRF